MSSTRSLPDPTTDSRPNTRAERALCLYEEHGHEITRIAPDVYRVPSQDGERSYDVVYGEREQCPCADHQYRHVSCVHLLAVGIAHAKKRFTTVRTVSVAGDPFAAAAARARSGRAATLAAALTAEECEDCGVSVAGPDEGVVALDGTVLCHGCAIPTY